MERGTLAKADFARATAHERELNGRQRQVLDLLVAGRTNAEIAANLGLTFDGAKWNVSEILSKLGFDSREDAAAYWRWRNAPHRRANRILRGLFASTAAKIAAGAAGVTVVGGAVLAFWLALGGGTSGGAPGIARPFYLEATIKVHDDAVNVGVNPAGSVPAASSREEQSTLRWWYQDKNHGRWEVNRSPQSLDARLITIIYDGKDQWSFDNSNDTYTQNPLYPLPAELLYRPLELSTVIGPIPAKSIDEFVTMLRTSRVDAHAEIVGEETVLGRRTLIIEFGPASTSGSSTGGMNGTPTIVTNTSRGTIRYWIDPETRFALRSRSFDSGGGDYEAEVTTLQLDTEVPRDRLRATVPAGWTNSPGDGTSSSTGGQSMAIPQPGSSPIAIAIPTLPPPFLQPRYIPGEYAVQGQGRGDGSAYLDFTFDTHWLRIEQRVRPHGLPSTLTTGEKHTLPGNIDAYLQANGPNRAVAFARGQVAVLITADALPDDELLKIAANVLE